MSAFERTWCGTVLIAWLIFSLAAWEIVAVMAALFGMGYVIGSILDRQEGERRES